MEQEQVIKITIEHVYSVVGVLMGAITVLAGVIVYLNRKKETLTRAYRDDVVGLTKSFTEVTLGHAKALENNTKVIEKLPEQFVLQMKANGIKKA
jgi:hypothetical protein